MITLINKDGSTKEYEGLKDYYTENAPEMITFIEEANKAMGNTEKTKEFFKKYKKDAKRLGFKQPQSAL